MEAPDTAPVAHAVLDQLASASPQAQLYEIKAAQQSTLRKLKRTRQLLSSFNKDCKEELEDFLTSCAVPLEKLSAIRRDMDAIHTHLRALEAAKAAKQK